MASTDGNKSIGVVYWSHKAFCAGNTATALIQCRNIPHIDTMVSAQAYGYIFVDTRWLSADAIQPKDIFKADTNFPLNRIPKVPKMPKATNSLNRINDSFCIFTTQMEVLDRTSILNDGMLVQFDIPHDALPTFRGMCCNIMYCLTLTFLIKNSLPNEELVNNTVRCLHFPFAVFGRGSGSVPQLLKYSIMTAYPLVSISRETLLSQPAIEDDFYDNQRRVSTLNNNDGAVYAIRDIEFVCTVCVGVATAIYCAGDVISLCLDFEKCVQQCFAVKARLVQCEKRPDGSRLQERTLDSVLRNTGSAISVYLILNIPDITESCFKTPFCEVTYQVIVEFFLSTSTHNRNIMSDSSLESEPLAWSMNIDIMPLCYQSINPLVEVMHCLDMGAVKVLKTTETY